MHAIDSYRENHSVTHWSIFNSKPMMRLIVTALLIRQRMHRQMTAARLSLNNKSTVVGCGSSFVVSGSVASVIKLTLRANLSITRRRTVSQGHISRFVTLPTRLSAHFVISYVCMLPPPSAAGDIMFSGCQSVCASQESFWTYLEKFLSN